MTTHAPARARRNRRRLAALLAATAATLAGALTLVEPTAMAEDAASSHVVVTQEYNAQFAGTIVQADQEMLVGMYGPDDRVLKVGGLELGPVASFHQAQQAQVDYVLVHSDSTSGFPTRMVAASTTVSFAAGADPTQPVLVPAELVDLPPGAGYYTVQYEVHWTGGTSVYDGFSVQATIDADDNGSAYACVVTECSLDDVSWAGHATVAVRI
jgi:hypothetical protein